MLVNSTTGQFLDGPMTRILPAPIVADSSVGTGVGVLVGTAGWGPINEPQTYGTMPEFVAGSGTYHTDDDDNETTAYFQAWGYFKGGKKTRINGGGRDLRFIRVASGTAAKATGTFSDSVPAVVGTLSAKYKGKLGDGIQRVIEDGDLRLAAPDAPGLAASAADGTLATGTLYVKITGSNNRGETTGSAVATVAVTGPTGSVTVTKPATFPDGTTHWTVYAGTAVNDLRKIGAAQVVATATKIITAVPGSTAIPTTNTAATSFTLTIVPFDGSAPEVFANLTPATAADIVNDEENGSKWVTYAAGAGVLIPTPGTAFLSGGNSGLDVEDTDYIGAAGVVNTGLELAATVADANFVWSALLNDAVKAQLESIATANFVQTVIGPDTSSVSVDEAIAEQNFNNWAIVYIYSFQKWKNPVSGTTQNVLPTGSVIGALCNGPHWVNLTQTKLNGYLGPTNTLSETNANKLAKAQIVPITDGSVCRKGNNTSFDASINQIEDFRIPVFIARTVDNTVRPLIGEPQVYNPDTQESDFFDNLRMAMEQVIDNQEREAIMYGYVNAEYDQSLAEQNKVHASMECRQTGKANSIIIDITAGRTALRVVPEGAKLVIPG